MEDDFQLKSIGITKFVHKTEYMESILIEAKWLVGIGNSIPIIFSHSLAYWILGNKVVLEAISVNTSKVPSPTVYLFAI